MGEIFGTDGARGAFGQYPITAEGAEDLGRATAYYFSEQGIGSVVIGEDTRATCPELAEAVSEGVLQMGLDVERVGVVPTPAVAYLTQNRNSVGVMISASHCTMPDNGLKIFGPGGSKLSLYTEDRIEQLMTAGRQGFTSAGRGFSFSRYDRIDEYVNFLRTTAGDEPETLFADRRIVLDMANGSASAIAAPLFRSLGAEVIATYDQPDGQNINQSCGAADEVGLAQLASRQTQESADAGIAFDGDADRVMFSGLDGDDLLYILAHDRQQKIKGVVGTVMSNLGLDRALEQMNIAFHRAGVGDRNVLYKLKEHGLQLGGEQSGHLITRYLGTGDGMLTAIQVMKQVRAFNKPIGTWRAELDALRVPQRNIKLETAGQTRASDALVAEAVAEIQSHYGREAYILVRDSGTEARTVRVTVQADRDIDGVLEHVVGRISPLLAA